VSRPADADSGKARIADAADEATTPDSPPSAITVGTVKTAATSPSLADRSPATVAPTAAVAPRLAATTAQPQLTPLAATVRAVVVGVLGLFGFDPNNPDANPVLGFLWGLYRRVESLWAPDVVAPAVSIADTSLTEGDTGQNPLSFTVTLDKASTETVSVQYATSNGTATAGVDYVASTGTVTFAPGVTSQQVQVNSVGDAVVEPNETFTVQLSNPSGVTIADGTATGTIVNDDVAAPGQSPSINISDASAVEGNPGTGGMAPGWFSTSGNQILDSAGNPVQIAGVNWFGMEGTNRVPDGLWTRNYKDMIDQMDAEGFNTIRLPYSSESLHNTNPPSGIDYSKNPDLQGLSSVQVMDKIVDYAGDKGMKVILDHHRSTAGAGTSENGLWYNSQYSEDQWVADWQFLANRYKDDPTVIGFDLHNEPYNGTWGGGGATDWARAAERAGNASLAVNPKLLIFVEGVGTYQGQSYWWGGNLMGVKDRPIVLNVPNRVVYSPHDYPNSVYAQPWFQGANFAAGLPDTFENAWGYIYEDGIAPVYIGEFGTKLVDPKDGPWLEALTSYISGDFDNNGSVDIPAGTDGISWTFWSWNPNSGDTGGILADDWKTVNENKMVYLDPIESPVGDGTPGDHRTAQFVIKLDGPSTAPVTVYYATVGGTATAGTDFVGTSGSVTFAPGETSKTVTVSVISDTKAESKETFTVALSNASGASIADGTGIGTIVDDDGAAAA
jgi:endoglucanase